MLAKLMCSDLTSPEEKREARRLQWYAVATGLVAVVLIAIISQIMKDVFKDPSAAFNVFFSALIMLVAMTYCYVVYLVRIQIKEQMRRREADRERQ
jgi:amino acid permease